MIGSERVVFISFVPGSFGSFLLHCLSYSPNVYYNKTSPIYFDSEGASHYNIKQHLDFLHDGYTFKKWAIRDEVSKIKELENKWDLPKNFIESNKYYLHRITLPKLLPALMLVLPNSKFINISVPKKYNEFIREQMERKSLGKNDIRPNYVRSIGSNAIIDGTYNFDVSHFIEGTFVEEFYNLCEWLNFEKVDISLEYENFKKANKII